MGQERQRQAPVEGQPVLDLRRRPGVLAAALAAARFPARREELIADAEESFASDAVMSKLRELPADREFLDVQAVWEALGGDVESRKR